MKTKVYCAGPLSQGDLLVNIQRGCAAGLALIKAGYAALVPHTSCYLGGPTPELLPDGTTHEDWYSVNTPFVLACDALLRLPGPSRGADLEEETARAAGIPVFDTLSELTAVVPPERPARAGDARFHALLDRMRDLHMAKATDYGLGNDPLANLRASADLAIEPWRGVLLRINDKMTRLKAYCQNGSLANESVEDTLMDISCYCLLAIILHGEKDRASMRWSLTVPVLQEGDANA